MTEAGIKMVAGFEGLPKGDPLAAYWDNNGKVWTIGYGATHYPDNTKVKEGDRLNSKEEALDLLENMLQTYENKVVQLVAPTQLNDNQKDALTSFTYNVGSGNFADSTLLKYVKADPNDERIKGEFAKWRKSGGKVLDGLVKRRAKEAAHYFNTEVEDLSGYIESDEKDSFDGSGNMFDELLHSADWTVTRFKIAPAKFNNWKNLNKGTSCPKVGDLLFGCHDFHRGDDKFLHDHVAIYLGTHNGNVYVAEGKSVSDTDYSNIPINQTDRKVQVARIENSRFGLNTDVITHFAHCNKVSIEQTMLVGLTNSNFTSLNYTYAPVVGEENMKHFTLVDNRTYRYKPGESSLTYSDTAHSNNIVNTPNKEQKQNLVNLVNYLLDPLYEAAEAAGIGKIIISSGFRNEDLNKEITGRAKSQHILGQAVDIQIKGCQGSAGNALLKVAQLLLTLEKTQGFSYDQMIFERFDSQEDMENLRPVWLHLSYKSKDSNRTYNDDTKLEYWNGGNKYIHLKPEDVLSKPTT